MMTPKTVEQLLQVFRLFRDNHASGKPLHASYHDAVREVARLNSVTYQTIGDGCRRRLRLADINELYELLAAWVKGDSRGLIQQLKQSSDLSAHAEIDAFFSAAGTEVAEKKKPLHLVSHENSETFSFRLSSDDARMLKALAELEGTSVGALSSRVVSEAVQSRMTTVARSIIKRAEARS
jgi:hypothetical protein